MEKFIVDSMQEIFLFDLPETMILLYFYMVTSKVKFNKIQFVYSVGLITIVDFIMSALNLPIVMQLLFMIIIIIYLKNITKISLIKNLFIIFKCSILFILIEISYIILIKLIFNIQIIGMELNLIRFYYTIPCRIIEYIIIKLYSKYLGGELRMKNNKKIWFVGSIIKRKLQK